MRVLLAFCALTFSFPLVADIREFMWQDLDQIHRHFEFRYAPTEWKRTYSGWNLSLAVEWAKQEVALLPDPNLRDFHRIVRRLMNTAQDYHVECGFYRTESATLPFQVVGAQGRYFLSGIDRNRLPEKSFPFQNGDELVAIDGQPTSVALEALVKEEFHRGNPATDSALALLALTNRSGALGQRVPTGVVTISIRPQQEAEVYHRQLIWEHRSEFYRSRLGSYNEEEKACLKPAPRSLKWLKSLSRAAVLEEAPYMGKRNGSLPPLGKIVWESAPDSPFQAYVALTDDRLLVGYLRIGHYVWLDPERAMSQLEEILAWMQESTDALVLDQTTNQGGYLFSLYGLLSMLSDQPLNTPRHHLRLVQEDIAEAWQSVNALSGITSEVQAREVMGDTLQGFPVTYEVAQFILNFSRFVMAEWNAGREYTRPYYLFGVDKINPHPHVQYTRPLVMLIDELNFSAADFCAAILRDNGRALLMGRRTSGAGGTVVRSTFPNRTGIAFLSLTRTLAERMDSSPIENLGVEPHVPYEVTVEDLHQGFKPYAAAVLREVRTLISS